MRNYDFCILSPYEFECFVRDILIKRDGIDYSNFAVGRDGGIDLRASYGNGKKVIVQAKRHKNLSELMSKLKPELEKIRKLNPDRYIVATSVDLTAKNKDDIKTYFAPYIKDDSDILGRQDFNKLLEQHKDVEMQYYRLWLSSANVMQNFINKHIITRSAVEMNEIKDTVKTYVMTPSYSKALDVLKKNRYVILSGVPGVGKTTLARMLCYRLLSKEYGYESFYSISNDIDDAYRMIQTGEKQIFFFDDFLGSTRFRPGENNFDAGLIKFIHEIQRQGDKLFILTTREYVLQDAKKYYERLSTSDIEMAKCVVDVGEYSDFVKAQILYNHLSDSGIRHDYIEAVKDNRNYMKLINHKNFNPRIIETFVNQAKYETVPPEKYFNKLLGYFDNPLSVWENAYNQLSSIGKEMLQVLASMNPPVMYKDWELAYNYFFENIHKEANYLDGSEWKTNVKTLMNSFISVDSGSKGLYVDFHNPGIKDFVIQQISKDENIQGRLLKSCYYIEQVYSIFQDHGNRRNYVYVTPNLYDTVIETFNKNWSDFHSCYVLLLKSSNTDKDCSPFPQDKINALSKFYDSYSILCKNNPQTIITKIDEKLLLDNGKGSYSVLGLLNKIPQTWIRIDKRQIFEYFKGRLVIPYDCEEFIEALEGFLSDFKEYKEDREFHNTLDGVILADVESEEGYCDDESFVERLEKSVPSWDTTMVMEAIQDHNDRYEEQKEDEIEESDYSTPIEGDDERIDNMFSTLE